MKLLIVDDSKTDSMMLSNMLKDYDLRTAADGVEAMEYLQRRGRFADRPDEEPVVLLLDIKMPRMDGLEVLRRIRADERLRRLPVVILSSSREESDLVRSWDLGANAYVVKPVDVGQFFGAVKTLGRFWAVINEIPGGEG